MMENVLTVEEAAQRLRISKRSLERLRVVGKGPAYVKLTDRRVGYLEADLDAWLQQRRRASTSDQGKKGTRR